MKFLDANGLALFTKKIFSKFVSNVSGADNKITITKGDGTTNEINLNEVLKTDEIAENPPEDDNTLKIASTSWVQSFVSVMVFKLIAKLAGTEETGVGSSGSFLGVKWLIAQNGYVNFGKIFGNFLFQWGIYTINTGTSASSTSNLYEGFDWIPYNISFKPDPTAVVAVIQDVYASSGEKTHISQLQSNQFEACVSCYKSNAQIKCAYLAVGRTP